MIYSWQKRERISTIETLYHCRFAKIELSNLTLLWSETRFFSKHLLKVKWTMSTRTSEEEDSMVSVSKAIRRRRPSLRCYKAWYKHSCSLWSSKYSTKNSQRSHGRKYYVTSLSISKQSTESHLRFLALTILFFWSWPKSFSMPIVCIEFYRMFLLSEIRVWVVCVRK